jgi:integrase
MPSIDLAEEIRKSRPHLSDNSVKTYKSVLSNLFKRCYPDDDNMTIAKFNDSEKVLESLADIVYNKRKSILSALVVLTGNPKYSELMMSDLKEYNDNLLKQEKTGKFDNMIPYDEVEAIVKKYAREASQHYKMAKPDLQKIQNYILLCCCSGVYQAPRRSADWNMKFRNWSEDDNYCDIKKKVFVFNQFKTKKSKGTQTIEIAKPLLSILKKWISVIPADCDYLFFDTKKQPLLPAQITHRLNAIFDKPISTSCLRHIYLTHHFGNVNLQKLSDTATAMGNTPMTALTYVKR